MHGPRRSPPAPSCLQPTLPGPHRPGGLCPNPTAQQRALGGVPQPPVPCPQARATPKSCGVELGWCRALGGPVRHGVATGCHGVVMGWLRDGHRVVMGWLWGGRGVVMGWPWGRLLPTPGAPLAVSPLSIEPTAWVCVRLGEPRETPNPKRRRSRRTAFILPYLLGVAFRETLWPAPPAGPPPPLPRGCWPIASPTRPPPGLLPPSPRAAAGQGATKPAGRSRPQRQKNKQKKPRRTPTTKPKPI